jgi:hypothetical protein
VRPRGQRQQKTKEPDAQAKRHSRFSSELDDTVPTRPACWSLLDEGRRCRLLYNGNFVCALAVVH